ncbi:MAG: SDR family oxidoreductase [Deltaproteobacteria bacterium]|nr:SDR family oxidoreductase [Deltaproteobacteria bacterium]MCB9785055.1 SDR family oxidoreductase [Deltaproteobacteria bacterium]
MAFRGKVALVTGAASGMGRIAARRLAMEGVSVALVDLNAEGLEETALARPGMHQYVCDVGDPEAVQETVARVQSELGPIERVTHAAAIMPTAPVMEMPLDRIHTLMRVNYGGTVNIVKATLPAMLERRSGDLILFGSLAGHVLAPHFGPYSATKAAVNALAEILIEENRGSGVRILLVCPPMVNTPLLEQAATTSNPRSMQLGIEQGRMASPVAIIDAIEEALEKGRDILFPNTEAKVLYGLRRFAPRLLWKLVHKAESA